MAWMLRGASKGAGVGALPGCAHEEAGRAAGSTALEQCRAQGRWPASYDRFWEILRQRQGKQAGTRAMIEVLLLAREHGPAPVRHAVEEALELGCSDVAAVRYLLSVAGLEPQAPVAPVHLGALNRYEIGRAHV